MAVVCGYEGREVKRAELGADSLEADHSKRPMREEGADPGFNRRREKRERSAFVACVREEVAGEEDQRGERSDGEGWRLSGKQAEGSRLGSRPWRREHGEQGATEG
jgi:hypothetical protein